MSISVQGILSQYNDYKVDVDRVKQRNEKQKDSAGYNQAAEISDEGRKTLENRLAALAAQRTPDGICSLSSVSSYGYISDFEKILSELGKGNVSSGYMIEDFSMEITDLRSKFEMAEGEKADSFDCHVNKMVSAYYMMRNKIEAKYADSEREVEYYVADNGEMEELTIEKELEMLDRAYTNHSTFMATSTEIWAKLNDFTPSVAYYNAAYQAFEAAISDENRVSLAQQKGNLDHLKLNLGISVSVRSMLNAIWDYG